METALRSGRPEEKTRARGLISAPRELLDSARMSSRADRSLACLIRDRAAAAAADRETHTLSGPEARSDPLCRFGSAVTELVAPSHVTATGKNTFSSGKFTLSFVWREGAHTPVDQACVCLITLSYTCPLHLIAVINLTWLVRAC